MILLVAVVLLFVVGAMAVLAIDVATLYTARSEAQLAADGAALAGARVLANSRTTSDPSNATLASNARTLATTIAIQVASDNEVGGRILNPNPNSGEIVVSFPNASGSNPEITVQVTRSDLPTFFARIWGNVVGKVTATATAEAFNPSPPGGTATSAVPIAPICVKPWILPNMADSSGNRIFDPTTGVIQNAGLILGQPIAGNGLQATCGNGVTTCAVGIPAKAWQYFPGDPTSSFSPTQDLPGCSTAFTGVKAAYQLSIAGCVQQPIQCGGDASGGAISNVTLYTGYPDATADQDAAEAVNCLTHSQNGGGDQLLPYPYDNDAPFQFSAGADNPVVKPANTVVTVSDSLVTIPVANVSNGAGGWTSSSVQVIGFVQVFLNPNGAAAGATGLPATVTNLVGCGTGATGQPIFGNGPSAVAVRLIHP